MKNSREFEIAFVGLKPGIHVFNYQIKDSFFENLYKVDFENAEIDIKLSLDKKNHIFLLHFDINGTVLLPCDRCGDPFKLAIWDEYDIVVKMIDDHLVSKKSEEDAEVSYIGKSESILNIEKYIYECIILSIPMQHIHPYNELGESNCNKIALEILNRTNNINNTTLGESLKQIKK